MEANVPTIRTKLHTALEALDAQLKNIKSITDMPYKTNGDFKWAPNSFNNTPNSVIRINQCKDLATLINIHQYIRCKDESYNESAKQLNLINYPIFTWQGYSWNDWKNDLNIRVAIVSQYEQTKRVKEAKSKLERFLTEEDQLAITLNELGL